MHIQPFIAPHNSFIDLTIHLWPRLLCRVRARAGCRSALGSRWTRPAGPSSEYCLSDTATRSRESSSNSSQKWGPKPPPSARDPRENNTKHTRVSFISSRWTQSRARRRVLEPSRDLHKPPAPPGQSQAGVCSLCK